MNIKKLRFSFWLITMEIMSTSRIPEKKGVVGAREIAKAAKEGKIRHIIIASNCPDFLVARLEGTGARIERFDGDEQQLATKLGKPFPIAMAGFEDQEK